MGFHIASAHQPLKTMPIMTATCIQYGCLHHTCENIPVHKLITTILQKLFSAEIQVTLCKNLGEFYSSNSLVLQGI